MAEATRVTERNARGDAGMSRASTLDEAIEARERFLREHPGLQAFQDEINRILQKAVDSENRMAALSLLIEAKIHELKDAVGKLRSPASKGHTPVESASNGLNAEVKRRVN